MLTDNVFPIFLAIETLTRYHATIRGSTTYMSVQKRDRMGTGGNYNAGKQIIHGHHNRRFSIYRSLRLTIIAIEYDYEPRIHRRRMNIKPIRRIRSHTHAFVRGYGNWQYFDGMIDDTYRRRRSLDKII